MESPTESQQERQPDSSGSGSPPIIPVVPIKGAPQPAEVTAVIMDPASKQQARNTPPTTTSEQDRKTAGQRNVNIIWELTQAFIAIGITAAEIYVSIMGKPSPSIDNAFTLIVAIYFVRMNHTKVGGVGGTDSR